jgi:hypothetical protein
MPFTLGGKTSMCLSFDSSSDALYLYSQITPGDDDVSVSLWAPVVPVVPSSV